jgi:hypothetical protein
MTQDDIIDRLHAHGWYQLLADDSYTALSRAREKPTHPPFARITHIRTILIHADGRILRHTAAADVMPAARIVHQSRTFDPGALAFDDTLTRLSWSTQ